MILSRCLYSSAPVVVVIRNLKPWLRFVEFESVPSRASGKNKRSCCGFKCPSTDSISPDVFKKSKLFRNRHDVMCTGDKYFGSWILKRTRRKWRFYPLTPLNVENFGAVTCCWEEQIVIWHGQLSFFVFFIALLLTLVNF